MNIFVALPKQGAFDVVSSLVGLESTASEVGGQDPHMRLGEILKHTGAAYGYVVLRTSRKSRFDMRHSAEKPDVLLSLVVKRNRTWLATPSGNVTA